MLLPHWRRLWLDSTMAIQMSTMATAQKTAVITHRKYWRIIWSQWVFLLWILQLIMHWTVMQKDWFLPLVILIRRVWRMWVPQRLLTAVQIIPRTLTVWISVLLVTPIQPMIWNWLRMQPVRWIRWIIMMSSLWKYCAHGFLQWKRRPIWLLLCWISAV